MLDLSWFDVKDRTIFLWGDINGPLALFLAQALHLLLRNDARKPITIHMSTDGGNVPDGQAMCDMLWSCPVVVNMYVWGSCDSMGLVVLQGATRRYVSKWVHALAHQGSVTIDNTILAAKAAMVRCDTDVHNDYEILLTRVRQKHPHTTKEDLEKLFSMEKYLSAQDLQELGLCDELISTFPLTGGSDARPRQKAQ